MARSWINKYLLYVGKFVSGVASQYHGASVDCAGCNKPIRSGSITVQAPRIGEEVSVLIVTPSILGKEKHKNTCMIFSSPTRQKMSLQCKRICSLCWIIVL